MLEFSPRRTESCYIKPFNLTEITLELHKIQPYACHWMFQPYCNCTTLLRAMYGLFRVDVICRLHMDKIYPVATRLTVISTPRIGHRLFHGAAVATVHCVQPIIGL